MSRYTNLHNVDISLAVWLLHDDYDFVPKERAISMTSLLKPTRQIILTNRVDPAEVEIPDLTDNIAKCLGHAIHDGIEKAWKRSYRKAMRLMNIPEKVIDRVMINPEQEDIDEFRKENEEIEPLLVFIEKRGTRDLNGWTISGKMDMSFDGRVKDTKSTSVWSYVLGSKDEDYILQMSGYRWLHPDKITEDEGDIQFVFTDWQNAMAKQNANYPEKRILSYPLKLKSPQEIENWMAAKLREVEKYIDADEADIPRCTDKELWRSDPVWKYYSNPNKTDGRATKNFDDENLAYAYMQEKGKGIVKEIPGEVKACGYCPAFTACRQKDEYFS